MMARRSFLSIAASLGGALALAGCDKPGSGAAYRYRLTLDVETPEGAKTGSSVIEVRTWETHFEGKRTNHEVTGQAVVVDLGARGLLFALLAGRGENGGLGSVNHAAYLPALVALRGGKLRDSDPAFQKNLSSTGGGDLIDKEIPFLVRFREIDDPKTVEAVDPNDLAKSFGEGVRLKRATIEMTSDPVTTGIEKKLGWMNWPHEILVDYPDGRAPMRLPDVSPRGWVTLSIVTFIARPQ